MLLNRWGIPVFWAEDEMERGLINTPPPWVFQSLTEESSPRPVTCDSSPPPRHILEDTCELPVPLRPLPPSRWSSSSLLRVCRRGREQLWPFQLSRQGEPPWSHRPALTCRDVRSTWLEGAGVGGSRWWPSSSRGPGWCLHTFGRQSAAAGPVGQPCEGPSHTSKGRWAKLWILGKGG